MDAVLPPGSLSRIVHDHLFETAVFGSFLAMLDGDRVAARREYQAAMADDLPELALVVWASSASWLGCDCIGFG